MQTGFDVGIDVLDPSPHGERHARRGGEAGLDRHLVGVEEGDAGARIWPEDRSVRGAELEAGFDRGRDGEDPIARRARAFDIYPTFGYRPHSTFELADSREKPAAGRGVPQRTLYYMDTREIAGAAPGTSASFVPQHVSPVCQFTRAEQRLLRKGLDGLTDQQIAAELGLSLNTLKSTWRSIYDRVASHAPFVLSGMDGGADDGGVRGTEKRRGVLSFVEDHPQELRPYLKDGVSGCTRVQASACACRVQPIGNIWR